MILFNYLKEVIYIIITLLSTLGEGWFEIIFDHNYKYLCQYFIFYFSF